MNEINFFLQKVKINDALNTVIFLAKRKEVDMRCIGEKYRKKEHYFEEECVEKMKETESL
jgi:hypothetical protein